MVNKTIIFACCFSCILNGTFDLIQPDPAVLDWLNKFNIEEEPHHFEEKKIFLDEPCHEATKKTECTNKAPADSPTRILTPSKKVCAMIDEEIIKQLMENPDKTDFPLHTKEEIAVLLKQAYKKKEEQKRAQLLSHLTLSQKETDTIIRETVKKINLEIYKNLQERNLQHCSQFYLSIKNLPNIEYLIKKHSRGPKPPVKRLFSLRK